MGSTTVAGILLAGGESEIAKYKYGWDEDISSMQRAMSPTLAPVKQVGGS